MSEHGRRGPKLRSYPGAARARSPHGQTARFGRTAEVVHFTVCGEKDGGLLV